MVVSLSAEKKPRQEFCDGWRDISQTHSQVSLFLSREHLGTGDVGVVEWWGVGAVYLTEKKMLKVYSLNA